MEIFMLIVLTIILLPILVLLFGAVVAGIGMLLTYLIPILFILIFLAIIGV